MRDDDDYPTGRFRIEPHADDEPTGWRETFGYVRRRVDQSPEVRALRMLNLLAVLAVALWSVTLAVMVGAVLFFRWLLVC